MDKVQHSLKSRNWNWTLPRSVFNSHGLTVMQRTRDQATYKCTLHKISQLDSTKFARFVKTLRRENKTKCRSRIRSTKRGFVKKNVRGFRYKPRGDWFSFGKVRKLCFLCSCKQTLVFARLTWACATPTSGGICRKGSLFWKRVQQLAEVTQNCLYHFKYGYLKKKKTGGLYSPAEPCEGHFNMDGCALFDYFWTVEQKNSMLL